MKSHVKKNILSVLILVLMLSLSTGIFAFAASDSDYIGSKQTSLSGDIFYRGESKLVSVDHNFSKWYFLRSTVEEIEIGASVTEVLPGSFTSCQNLKSIDVSADNQYFTSVEGVLYNKDLTQLIAYPINKDKLSFTLPNSVKSIAPYAFSKNNILNELILNSGIEIIGENAFYNASISKINLPLSLNLEAISKDAFTGARFTYFAVQNPDILKTELIPYDLRYNMKTLEYLEGITELNRKNMHSSQSIETLILPASLEVIEQPDKGEYHKNAPSSLLVTYTNLHTLKVSEDNKVFKSDGTTLWDKNSKTLLLAVSSPKSPVYIIPDEIEKLGIGSFTSLRTYKTIMIGKNLKEIDNYGVFFASANYFSDSRLENFVVDSANPYFTAYDGVLFGKDESGALTRLIKYPQNKQGIFESYEATDTETNEKYNFSNCYVIPKSVKTIDGFAFYESNSISRFYMTGPGEKLLPGSTPQNPIANKELVFLTGPYVFDAIGKTMFVRGGTREAYITPIEGKPTNYIDNTIGFGTAGTKEVADHETLGDPFYIRHQNYGMTGYSK